MERSDTSFAGLELSEAERDGAVQAVRAIARALCCPPPAWIPAEDAEPFRVARGAALAHGSAGIALFFATLAQAGPSVDGVDAPALARHYASRALDALERIPLGPGLFDGLAGIVWSARATHRLLGDEDDDDLEVEGVLAGVPYDRHGFELWNGLAGIALLGMQRSGTPSGAALIQSTVAALDEHGVRGRYGVHWPTPPASLKPRQRLLTPAGDINLGVAHGQAGVVHLLAQCLSRSRVVPRAEELLDPAVAFLIAAFEGAPLEDELALPVVGRGGAGELDAWCNGGLGVSLALLRAAKVRGRHDWQMVGLELARRSARATPAELPPGDASLCHGAAGRAYLLSRLERITGEAPFAESARVWLRHALELRQPETGVGGYCCFGYDREGELCVLHDPGFIHGAAGTGLALLGTLTDAACGWEAPLMLDGLVP